MHLGSLRPSLIKVSPPKVERAFHHQPRFVSHRRRPATAPRSAGRAEAQGDRLSSSTPPREIDQHRVILTQRPLLGLITHHRIRFYIRFKKTVQSILPVLTVHNSQNQTTPSSNTRARHFIRLSSSAWQIPEVGVVGTLRRFTRGVAEQSAGLGHCFSRRSM